MNGSASNVLIVGTNKISPTVNVTSNVVYEFVNDEAGASIEEEVMEFNDEAAQYVEIIPDEVEEVKQEKKFEEKKAKNQQCKWTYKRRMISEDFKFDQLNRQ